MSEASLHFRSVRYTWSMKCNAFKYIIKQNLVVHREKYSVPELKEIYKQRVALNINNKNLLHRIEKDISYLIKCKATIL